MLSVPEMLYELDLRADRLSNKSLVSLPVPAKIALLNAAQLAVIKNRQPEFEDNSRHTDDLQNIHVTGKSLKPKKENSKESLYVVPFTALDEDKPLFVITRVYCYGTFRNCGNTPQRVRLYSVQTDDLELALSNSNRKPSLRWRRGLVRRAGNKLEVYTDNFEIPEVVMDYLRYPVRISLEGYENFDGTESKRVECELPLSVQDDIINEAVVNTRMYTGDAAVQLALAQVQRTTQ